LQASTNVNTIVDGFFAVGKAATDPDEDPKKKKTMWWRDSK
jgi:hypothetical protein